MAKRATRSITAKSSYRSLPPGTDMMMLAPFVISLRMPMLMWEMATPQFSRYRLKGEGSTAVVEKSAAVFESYGAMQAEMLQAWTRIWLGAMVGDVPNAKVISHALQDIVDAGVEPAAKRVRANYRRLRKM